MKILEACFAPPTIGQGERVVSTANLLRESARHRSMFALLLGVATLPDRRRSARSSQQSRWFRTFVDECIAEASYLPQNQFSVRRLASPQRDGVIVSVHEFGGWSPPASSFPGSDLRICQALSLRRGTVQTPGSPRTSK